MLDTMKTAREMMKITNMVSKLARASEKGDKKRVGTLLKQINHSFSKIDVTDTPAQALKDKLKTHMEKLNAS